MPKAGLEADVVTRLREAISASGFSLNKLGQQAGIDQSRLSRFMRGERDLTLAAAARLCNVLGLGLIANGSREAAPAPTTASSTRQPPARNKRAKARPRKKK